EVGGCGLAKVTQCHLCIAQARRDQRVHPRAERTAVGAARLVMAEIRLGHRAGEFLGQQRDQRYYVGLLHHLAALGPFAAGSHVDGDGGVGVGGEVERFQRVEAGELLIDAGRRIEADHDARDRVAPVRELVVGKRQLLPTASSARAMFQRAITLVKALSSTSSWYSSGPITWRMCRLPSTSATARDAQNRAVSSRISAPARRKKSSSPVARQYCHTA